MNFAEGIFERFVGYPIDWEATGTWMGAVTTAAAVYFAARMGEAASKRAAEELRKQRYRALAALYVQAAELLDAVHDTATPGKGGVRPTPPSAEQFGDLLGALGTVPVFELGNEAAIVQLFQVKHHLLDAIELLLAGVGSKEWDDKSVQLSTEMGAKLCRKIAEGGAYAAKAGWWPKPLGDSWVVLKEG